jgi:dimethylargininase
MSTSQAIVRPPGANFAAGVTSSREGPPNIELAREQHRAYCNALVACGLTLTALPEEPAHPDACFVEDVAIVTPRGAIATRPGDPSRQGEVTSVLPSLKAMCGAVARIFAPGTVDGGDVCEADGHYLIGLSARTNVAGAEQLESLLAEVGYSCSIVDIRQSKRLLHLKTGMTHLGDGRMVVTADVPRGPLGLFELLEVAENERYAANCVRVNDRVLIAAGYAQVRAEIEACGYEVLVLEMSEFRKMDGGLSCLSLRI